MNSSNFQINSLIKDFLKSEYDKKTKLHYEHDNLDYLRIIQEGNFKVVSGEEAFKNLYPHQYAINNTKSYDLCSLRNKMYYEIINKIDSTIDFYLKMDFKKALEDPSANLYHKSIPSVTYFFPTHEKFLELTDKIWNDTNSFMYFLKHTASSFIYCWIRVIVMMQHDYNQAIRIDNKSKCQNSTTFSIRRYLNLKYNSGTDRQAPVFNTQNKKSTIDYFKKELEYLTKLDIAENTFHDNTASQVWPSKIYREDNAPRDAILKFQNCYFSDYNFDEFVKHNLAFLNLYTQEKVNWLPPSFLAYNCTLLDSIGPSKEQHIFNACNKYRDRRIKGENYNEWQEFNSVKKAYTKLYKRYQTVCSRIFSSLACSCSAFMFDNLLHPNFISSLSSDIFQFLSKKCDISALIKYDGSEQVSDIEYQSILYYDLLKLLSIFNIDTCELSNCDFYDNKLTYNKSNLLMYTEIGKNKTVPLDFIYRFLYEVLTDTPKIVDNMLSEIELYYKNYENPNQPSFSLCNELFDKYWYWPSEKVVTFKPLNRNQKLIVNQLLYYASCLGAYGNIETPNTGNTNE